MCAGRKWLLSSANQRYWVLCIWRYCDHHFLANFGRSGFTVFCRYVSFRLPWRADLLLTVYMDVTSTAELTVTVVCGIECAEMSFTPSLNC